MIRFRCSACAAELSVQPQLAGLPAVCPKCRAKTTVPEPPVEMIPVPTPKPTLPRCIGCARPMHNAIECPETSCFEEFCSEVCLIRHLKATGHGEQGSAAPLLLSRLLLGLGCVLIPLSTIVCCGCIGLLGSLPPPPSSPPKQGEQPSAQPPPAEKAGR